MDEIICHSDARGLVLPPKNAVVPPSRPNKWGMGEGRGCPPSPIDPPKQNVLKFLHSCKPYRKCWSGAMNERKAGANTTFTLGWSDVFLLFLFSQQQQQQQQRETNLNQPRQRKKIPLKSMEVNVGVRVSQWLSDQPFLVLQHQVNENKVGCVQCDC